MKRKIKSAAMRAVGFVPLGENPVNSFQARKYAMESSPSPLAVINEAVENGQDNAAEVQLILDIDSWREDRGRIYVRPKKIKLVDIGQGLTHYELKNRFCGAFSDSEIHHDAEKAGRNGVGTKTYHAMASRVVVATTTSRPTEGLDEDREALLDHLPAGLTLPKDGEPDTLLRVYEVGLHTRGVLTDQWSTVGQHESGTTVELLDVRDGTEVEIDTLIERLSYARDWLSNPVHRLSVRLSGNVPPKFASRKETVIKPWMMPDKSWLTSAIGSSDQKIVIYDPTEQKQTEVPPTKLAGLVELDIRVLGRDASGSTQSLPKPALILEVCGALPYAPNLEANQSARTMPLLTFVGLEHASSIGAFCNSISGTIRVNAIEFKELLRNNKTTLATGAGAEATEELRAYLRQIIQALHRAWYNATRATDDAVARNAVHEAEIEVNYAIGGSTPQGQGGQIVRGHRVGSRATLPARSHRWECGNCNKRWLAAAGFKPKRCAEVGDGSGIGDGCGATSIGLARNQPRVGDCRIDLAPLGDQKLPASFQFEKKGDDLVQPVVIVNSQSPRFVELRGTGDLSKQAQVRLKQYLVDISLVVVAEFHARAKGSDMVEELGDLQFNRMLRTVGMRAYESQLQKSEASTSVEEEPADTAA